MRKTSFTMSCLGPLGTPSSSLHGRIGTGGERSGRETMTSENRSRRSRDREQYFLPIRCVKNHRRVCTVNRPFNITRHSLNGTKPITTKPKVRRVVVPARTTKPARSYQDCAEHTISIVGVSKHNGIECVINDHTGKQMYSITVRSSEVYAKAMSALFDYLADSIAASLDNNTLH